MTQAEIIYLLPYLGAFVLSVILLVFIWRKRDMRGSKSFFFYTLGHAICILSFIFELITPGVQGKLFWESAQWIASCLPVIIFPVFVAEYTETRLKHRRELFAASLIIPILFTILVATGPVSGLTFKNMQMKASGPFEVVNFDYSAVMIGFIVYILLIVSASSIILVRRMKRPRRLYRQQTTPIIIGALSPLIALTLAAVDIQITPHRSIYLFTAIFGNLLISWGIYRFRIFEVEPIARERVFEAMVEPLVILDNKNAIIDINSSMLVLLEKTEKEVIGLQAKDVFQDFPIPIKSYTSVTYARAEAEFKIGGRSVHYELTVWPLYNSRKELTGRIYISHDITALKELENELRKLNSELEIRVQSRTHELEEAYESMLEGLALALELRDKETEGHSRRVTEFAVKLAKKMGIAGEELKDIRSGSILHDIGKISIPDEILHKNGRLTPEERIIVEQHPETAFKLLSRIPFLSKAIEIPYCHHEKWDGTGYPRGLAGEGIPLSARIFAVADVWDALSNDRPYNKAWERGQIIEYFREQSGKHFDPIVVNLFLSMVEKSEI